MKKNILKKTCGEAGRFQLNKGSITNGFLWLIATIFISLLAGLL